MKRSLAWLLVVVMLLGLTGCGGIKADIVGTWEGAPDLYEGSNRKKSYPVGDYITFCEDGTFLTGRESGWYEIEDDQMTLSSSEWEKTYRYTVTFKEGMLVLQYPGAAPFYYEPRELRMDYD